VSDLLDTPATLPTVHEFECAARMLSDTVGELARLRWRVWYLADVEGERTLPGDPIPTAEEIVLVFVSARDLQRTLAEAAGYVDELVELVDDLDEARRVRLGPDSNADRHWRGTGP
jgi:hypothetical protein